MSIQAKKLIIPFIILALASVGAYYNFATYRPKILRKIEEVKGLKSESMFDIPYPRDAEKLGYSQTPTSRQTTFQTVSTQSEIQTFYRNILINEDWILDTERELGGQFSTRYKKGDKYISIISTREEESNYTIVSLEISDR